MAAKTASDSDAPAGAANHAGEATPPAESVELAAPDAQLTAALARAQARFPPIPKNRTGEVRGVNKSGQAYSYGYTYADLGDVLAAVRPVLAAEGLAITQPTIRENGGMLLLTTLRHVAGATLSSEVDLGQSPGNPQAFGGALTYLRRYELTTLLGIAAEEDRDAQDVEPDRGRAAAAPPEWARPASRGSVEKVVASLEAALGDRARAGELVDAVAAAAGGSMPVVAARALLGLTARLGIDADEALEAARARDEATAAQAAAEQPDPPAPDPTPDADPDPEPAPDTPPATIEPPAPFEHWPTSTDYLDALNARRVGEQDLPPLTLEEATAELRASGCTCPNPLGLNGPEKTDDGCPFLDHGIPF